MMDSRETRELAAQHSGGVSKHHASQTQRRYAPSLETFLSIEAQVPIATTGALPSPHATKLVLAQDALPSPMPHTVGDVSLLQKLNQVLVTATEPEAALYQITQVLGETFQADCYLAVHFSKESLPRTVYWWQSAEHVTRGLPQTQGVKHPALKSILNSSGNGLCIVSDLEATQSEADVDGESVGQPIRAVLGGTTQFQGQRNGVISLPRSQPHHWTTTEIANLNSVLFQVAIAISQFQIQCQIRQQNCRQALVEQLTVAIRNALDLNQILKLATEGTAQALQADRSFILMLKYSEPLAKSR